MLDNSTFRVQNCECTVQERECSLRIIDARGSTLQQVGEPFCYMKAKSFLVQAVNKWKCKYSFLTSTLNGQEG